MLLKDICTIEIVCCNPSTTVLAMARLMRQRHVGDVIVVGDPQSDQTPIGVVTDRDIVIEVLGKELDPAKVTAREIMRTPVVVADASENVSQVIERMKQHGVRRVPVMDENLKLAGVICLDDLLGRLASDAAALVEIVSHEQDCERRMRRSRPQA